MSTPKQTIHELPKPIDVQRALDEALVRLRAIGGDYALIGGVALGVYGIERFTKGVNLAATTHSTAAAETALKDCDPRPLQIGGVSIATKMGVRVDLIDRRFEYRELFEEAILEAKKAGAVVKTEHAELPLVPLPYLAAMKLIADRPQDEVDLRSLLGLDRLDYRATRDIVLRFAGKYAAQRLDKLARSVGRGDAPADYAAGDK
jgi:hypothetical protein